MATTVIQLPGAGATSNLVIEQVPSTDLTSVEVIQPQTNVNIELVTVTETDVVIQEPIPVIEVEVLPDTDSISVLPGTPSIIPPMLVQLPDVSTFGLEDKSLLLYNSTTGIWEPSKKLEDHFINAGQF